MACKLTLLHSLHLQKAAWSRVTQTMIINYYKQASFAPESDEEAGTSSDQLEHPNSADQASATETYTDLPTGLMADMFSC